MRDKRIRNILIILMVIIACVVSVPSALAYFTTYARVKTTLPVSLIEHVRIREEKIDGDKHVVLTVDEDSDPVFVRVRAYAAAEIENYLEYSYDTSKWTETTDGWYEYNEVMFANQTAVMDILIKDVDEQYKQFNVVVVYEYIPAIMDGNGGYVKDWDAKWTGGGN